MSSDSPNRDLLNAWKEGDQEAAAQLFRRYQARLLALVRSRLSRKLARRIDAEDILMSAYRSFFVGAQKGRCLTPESDDLWPLLTTIVLRKLARQARFQLADRRSIDREQPESSFLELLTTPEPTAEQAACMTEEIEQLLSRLDETAREVCVRTLQGHSVDMITKELQLHERSVRRAIERVRELVGAGTGATDSFVIPVASMKGREDLPIRRRRVQAVPGGVRYQDYLLKRFVGAGAFSKVYQAMDRCANRVVAIKYLKKDCWQDQRAIDALIREYEILHRLDHPGILKVYGWGTTPGGSVFLVTDFIEGCDLGKWRSTVRPRLPQILAVVRRTIESISAAHTAGIIHGDLKPENVMVAQGGQVTLCDFGLSRYATDADDVPNGGTAGFMAPEQICDAFGSVSVQTDVYGLGGLAYQLLTGRSPMTGRDLPEILARVLSARLPEPPLADGDEVSSRVNQIVLRCLEKEPERRFSSMGEVLSALDAL
jgi:tRNA A-37 threonylcarbamoyl transferase component Bud32/DNA-directed RNA polymerase specialized sigma24 family protein